jgi:glyoxylase-like metal-dependent hydrolase (beta-lactamase superfamily II)
MTQDLNISDAKPNVEMAALEVPDAVRTATPPPVKVVSQKLADGVWYIGGGTHNSDLIEFKDYVVVVEAPLDEARSNAVMAEVKNLVPNKPIKYLINSHHHFDHSGGLRTYVAEGIPIITNEANKPFYEKAWSAPRTLMPDKLSQNPKKATFITYKDKYTVTDENRTLEIYRVENDTHNAYISFMYLPKEKILIEGDDFTPPAPGAPPMVPVAMGFSNNLYDNLTRKKIEVVTISPLHGNVAQWSDFTKALGKSGD